MYKFSIVNTPSSLLHEKYVYFHFYDEVKDNNGNIKYSPLPNSPICGLTLYKGKSMRFRWNENNSERNRLLWEISCNLEKYEEVGDEALSSSLFSSNIGRFEEELDTKRLSKKFVPIQLFHTKDVFNIDKESDTKDKIGDGIITKNTSLVPTITVADCVPIYLFDKTTKVFGVVHSGWKGTGIAVEAIKLMMKEYNTKVSDVYVAIGPHIDECCYIVNEERANYFKDNFTPLCVTPVKDGEEIKGNWDNGSGQLYHLSLTKANIASLKAFGVLDSHITLCTDCTCCNLLYGSNRRETMASGEKDKFTVMASFISNR